MSVDDLPQGEFHSRFGGLWIDRSDWQAALEWRVQTGRLDPDRAGMVREFVSSGYVILPGAAEPSAIDDFQAKIARSFRDGNEHLLYQVPGSAQPMPVTAGVNRRGTRIVDAYAAMPEARRLLGSPRLIDFLASIFDDDPLLFQSLSFDQGSEQGLHQDTAYVVVDRPLSLAACWIALEDVRPGSGELVYLPGSHRYDDFDFHGKKHWSPVEDGNELHDAWARWIYSEGERRGLAIKRFMARRGDILVWHADLAHGGSPIADASLTRQSLVGHFCPLVSKPNYFGYAPDRAVIRRDGRQHYSSFYFDLAHLESA